MGVPKASPEVRAARNTVRLILCEEGLLTAEVAAQLLGVSARYIRVLAERGELQSVRIGKRIQIPRRAALQYAADRVQVK